MKVPFFLTSQGMENLQRMSHMIRYNNEIHFHDENVAEHSFYVAVYAILICDFLGINTTLRSKIVERAVTHDISETELSDIPHNVKKMIPGVKEFFSEFEKSFNEEHFEKSYKRMEIGYELLISSIVEIADILSVRQYSKQEVELGNKKKFEPILDGSNGRLKKVFEELKKYFGEGMVDDLEKILTESEV